MAVYTTNWNERLYNLALRFYGSLDDDAVMSIIVSNTHVFTGEGIFPYGTHLDIPDTQLDIEYGSGIPTDYATMKASFDGAVSVPAPASAGTTINYHPETGGEISENGAIQWAVLDALLSYRPERWFKPLYGTQLIEGMQYPSTRELAQALNALAHRVLSPYSERFEIIHVGTRIVKQEDTQGVIRSILEGVITVIRPLTNERITVGISLA